MSRLGSKDLPQTIVTTECDADIAPRSDAKGTKVKMYKGRV
jgi:hypothetical protein